MCVCVIKSVWVCLGVVDSVIGTCMVAEYMSGIVIGVYIGFGVRWGYVQLVHIY